MVLSLLSWHRNRRRKAGSASRCEPLAERLLTGDPGGSASVIASAAQAQMLTSGGPTPTRDEVVTWVREAIGPALRQELSAALRMRAGTERVAASEGGDASADGIRGPTGISSVALPPLLARL